MTIGIYYAKNYASIIYATLVRWEFKWYIHASVCVGGKYIQAAVYRSEFMDCGIYPGR